ncbi:MAG: hypothetical protein LBQ74_20700 [Prevotella sp.]|nr:hypothetical protein [Prevotella sp.]
MNYRRIAPGLFRRITWQVIFTSIGKLRTALPVLPVFRTGRTEVIVRQDS